MFKFHFELPDRILNYMICDIYKNKLWQKNKALLSLFNVLTAFNVLKAVTLDLILIMLTVNKLFQVAKVSTSPHGITSKFHFELPDRILNYICDIYKNKLWQKNKALLSLFNVLTAFNLLKVITLDLILIMLTANKLLQVAKVSTPTHGITSNIFQNKII